MKRKGDCCHDHHSSWCPNCCSDLHWWIDAGCGGCCCCCDCCWCGWFRAFRSSPPSVSLPSMQSFVKGTRACCCSYDLLPAPSLCYCPLARGSRAIPWICVRALKYGAVWCSVGQGGESGQIQIKMNEKDHIRKR